MPNAKGVHVHPYFKLGKAPVKKDKRTLKLAMFLKRLPPVPTEYDFDTAHAGFAIPTPMFGNDVHGDCVIAGRAHQTFRFEALEQGKVIPITEQEVLKEYWKQAGGTGPRYDKGLVVLDSLNVWRHKGWKAGGKGYSIHAYAAIDPKDPEQMRAAIYLLAGCGAGFSLPKTAQKQIDAGKPWDVVGGTGSAPGSWGGHYVYLCGYTKVGPMCVTWGRKQQMTWRFLAKYCDEAYGIVDNKDRFLKKSPLDVNKLEEYLAQL